eukprot:369061-Hanusia_phi.AAC.1
MRQYGTRGSAGNERERERGRGREREGGRRKSNGNRRTFMLPLVVLHVLRHRALSFPGILQLALTCLAFSRSSPDLSRSSIASCSWEVLVTRKKRKNVKRAAAFILVELVLLASYLFPPPARTAIRYFRSLLSDLPSVLLLALPVRSLHPSSPP